MIFLYITRTSVVPLQSPILTKRPKMTKNQYPSWISIYIIDIYISRLHPRGTDRQMYRLSIERIFSKSTYIPGVTKYLPRGLQYGSGQVIHGLTCLKCREFNA